MSDLKYGIKLKLSRENRFDLAEIFAPIGEEFLRELTWKVQLEFFVIHRESEFARSAEYVAPLGDGWIECRTNRRPWSYDQLVRLPRENHQVVDGEFIGYKSAPKGKKKWLVLKAFDSSFWEVWSEDWTVIDKVSAVFTNTERIFKSAI